MAEKITTTQSNTPTTTHPKTRISKTDIQQFLLRGRAFIALILVVIVFSLASPKFLTTENLIIMSKHVAINALLAIGMTFVILTGGIDLSVGSVVGLTAMIAGGLINEGIILPQLGVIVYPHTWMVMFLSLLVGTVMGAVSGFVITRFNVAPFIATLGMLYVARGFAGLRNNGYTFPNLVGRPEFGNTGFEKLGVRDFLGINYSIWIMIIFALVAYFCYHAFAFWTACVCHWWQRASCRAFGGANQSNQNDCLYDQRFLFCNGWADHCVTACGGTPSHG